MKSGKILIVEDELLIGRSISSILEQKGYDSFTVTSGEDALKHLPEYAPDIILMDIGLDGKLDGISTAGIIQQEYNVPVIFITDHQHYQIYRQAQTVSPYDYISKPFKEATILQAVENAYAKKAAADMGRTPLVPLGDRVENGIFVLYSGAYHKVLFADILYLEAQKNYTDIYCAGGRIYNVSMSSNHVAAQLNCPFIVKCAKSFYINIHRVDSITADTVIIGTREITIAPTSKQDIAGRLKKLSNSQAPGC